MFSLKSYFCVIVRVLGIKKSIQLLMIVLVFIPFFYSLAYSAVPDADKRRGAVEEEIWALEEAYFANLYKADHEAVLDIVHSQFLGWPGTAAQPLDKEGSALFMKQLAPKPTPCTFKIEREGIRVTGEAVLTQYIIHVDCGDAAKTQITRITHTWAKEGGRWKLLGGMSCDQ